MATFQFFDAWKETAVEGANLGSDAFKWMLTNVAPVATNSTTADLTEIAAGNGYTAGGNAVTVATSNQVGGVYTFGLNACTFTAAGGSFAAFRYMVLVDTTAAKLVGWLDYGASYTLTTGVTFTIPANTVFTLA